MSLALLCMYVCMCVSQFHTDSMAVIFFFFFSLVRRVVIVHWPISIAELGVRSALAGCRGWLALRIRRIQAPSALRTDPAC
ncbi:hypothetical protein F5884DRAFT_525781 [Xylogone sp. PMI_703]|nr:hypothetical protein F5884DRAFT_525781 [Xylogone sp. PMI_703]